MSSPCVVSLSRTPSPDLRKLIIPVDEGPPGYEIRTALAALQTGLPAYEQPTPVSVDFVVETSA